MKNIKLIALALFAYGCYKPQPVITPDGSPGIGIKCSGVIQCQLRAGEACPGGYDIVDKSHTESVESIGYVNATAEVTPNYDDSVTVNAHGIGTSSSWTVAHDSIIIKCKGNAEVDLPYVKETEDTEEVDETAEFEHKYICAVYANGEKHCE